MVKSLSIKLFCHLNNNFWFLVVSKKAKFEAENKQKYFDQFLGFVGEFQNKLTQPIKKKTSKKTAVTVKEIEQRPPSKDPLKVDQTDNVSDNSFVEEADEEKTETMDPEIDYLVDLINEEDKEKEDDEEFDEMEEIDEINEIDEIDDIDDVEDERSDPEHFSEDGKYPM